MTFFKFTLTKMSLTRTFLGVWLINLCFVANRLHDEVEMTACIVANLLSYFANNPIP